MTFGFADRVHLRLVDLSDGWPLRSERIDRRHVGVLMESCGEWPPIVVWGPANVIVDGAHRVAAAAELGMTEIETIRFDGSEGAAYLHALQCNARHGLPLTFEDRTRAAVKVMTDHPEWSDRRIATACSVSVMTVGKVRSERSSLEAPAPTHRVGQDGKWRPVHAAAVRAKIVAELQEDSSRSLRTIASIVGASPETVRSVRRSLTNKDERQANLVDLPAPSAPPEAEDPRPSATLRVVTDAAVISGAYGEEFAAWFDSAVITETWETYVDCVPQSRIYEIADEARRRSERWAEFARAVEGRVHRPAVLRA